MEYKNNFEEIDCLLVHRNGGSYSQVSVSVVCVAGFRSEILESCFLTAGWSVFLL